MRNSTFKRNITLGKETYQVSHNCCANNLFDDLSFNLGVLNFGNFLHFLWAICSYFRDSKNERNSNLPLKARQRQRSSPLHQTIGPIQCRSVHRGHYADYLQIGRKQNKIVNNSFFEQIRAKYKARERIKNCVGGAEISWSVNSMKLIILVSK